MLLLVGGCASDGGKGAAGNPLPSVTSTQKPARPVLSASKAASIGAIVIDAKGHTLYRFEKDTAKPARSNCAGSCEKKWPPVLAGDELSTKGVDQGLVGKVKRQDGRWQLTLAGWPLYRYAGDHRVGDVKGQNRGGVWFAIAPDGKKAAPGTATGGGDGKSAGGGTRTKWGPLSAADRALLVTVRQAWLWEIPMAQQAGKRAQTLPSRPNADQRKWVDELSSASSGKEFDELFVNRMRAAQGKTLAVVAQVRASTRNSLIRQFAQRAVGTCMKQMTLLENTGLVDDLAGP